MTKQEHRMAKAQAAVDAFNQRCPVGGRVRYWPWTRVGDGLEGVTKHEATVLASGEAVAWIEGAKGCIALTHVEVVE